MSVSNIKITPTSINAKAGDTIEFKVTWSGNPEYQHYVGDRISIRGASTFTNLVNIEKQYYSGRSFSFNMKVPDDWAGSKTGWFHVVWTDSTTQVNIVADTGVTPNCLIQTTGIMKPVVSLSPSNPTIRPNESALFSINVSGITAPFEVIKYEWFYKTTPIGGNTPTLSIPWAAPGYEFVLCRATIRKDGYEDAIVQGDTKLTMVKGTMDGVGVVISGPPPAAKLGEYISVQSTVTGVPDGVRVSYEWTVNGVRKSTDSELQFEVVKDDYTASKKADIKLIVSAFAPDYEGVTVESPIISVPIEKFTPSDIPSYISHLAYDYSGQWGPRGEVGVEWAISHTTGGSGKVYLIPEEIQDTPAVFLDDTDVSSLVKMDQVKSINKYGTQYYSEQHYFWPSLVGKHTYSTTIQFKETEWFTGGPVLVKADFTVSRNMFKDAYFIVDEKPLTPGSVYYVKAGMDQEIKFAIRNVFGPQTLQGYTTTFPCSDTYKTELTDIGKTGKFELIDFQGNVAATAINGVFTYTTPSEAKVLKGKIRHTIDNDSKFTPNPYIAEQDIEINIVANPMIPMPTIELVQTPNPVILGKNVKIERAFTNMPDGANIDDSRWFINQNHFENSPEISVIGEFDKSIRNNTFVYPENFDPAVLTADLALNVVLKPWPAISLVLQPARTTVPWGEFLISGYQLFGSDSIDDRSKLVVSSPDWYLDGTSLQTIAGDGSLMVRATHPGNHVIKAVVTLRHPDYENGEKVVEQSFNMTTEKREMATTLTLLPVDAVIGIGKTQKFTATVAGAPADATTTYVWTVDGTTQASTANNMDYKATTEGTKKVKVVATTKAQDAEDDVKEATVDLVVNKNTMVLTVIASTSTPTIKLGENYTIKCDVTGQPAGATIAYKWNSGETTQTVTKASTALGPIARKCTVTVKAADYDDAVIDSNTVTVQVEKKTQATTATISTSTPTIKQDEMYEAGCDVVGAPTGATIEYLWSTGEITENVVKTAHQAGDVKLKCKVTVKHADYEDKVIDTNEITIKVSKIPVPGVVVTVNSVPKPVKTGEEYTVTAVVTGYPVGSDVTFEWDSGETTSSIKRTQTTAGDYPHTVVVRVKHPDYNDEETGGFITVNVEASGMPEPDGCIRYVHPLEHRESAYIWAGWWVMREIERAADLGIDWKSPEGTVLNYKCDLKTLAAMMSAYPNIEVQESRNGYILNKADLDAGVIY